ncbi:MAG: hypothetical protein AB7G13_07415 [Lautropia sp.]
MAESISPERLRVGLLVPVNNTTMAGELAAWLPPGSTVEVRRIPRGKGLLTAATIPAYRDAALALARDFADPAFDIVAYGCTAASFIAGPELDADLRERLQQVTGRPVVTTAQSMVDALQAERARRITVVTPYLEAVNTQLIAYLAAFGIETASFASFFAPDTDALGRITAAEVAGLVRATHDAGNDAVFIACSQLPTFAIVDPLRLAFERPVWSSIRATAWQVLRSRR